MFTFILSLSLLSLIPLCFHTVTSTFDSTRSLLYQLAPVQSDNTQVLLVIDTAAWKVLIQTQHSQSECAHTDHTYPFKTKRKH